SFAKPFSLSLREPLNHLVSEIRLCAAVYLFLGHRAATPLLVELGRTRTHQNLCPAKSPTKKRRTRLPSGPPHSSACRRLSASSPSRPRSFRLRPVASGSCPVESSPSPSPPCGSPLPPRCGQTL